jgi:hypothetical protein
MVTPARSTTGGSRYPTGCRSARGYAGVPARRVALVQVHERNELPFEPREGSGKRPSDQQQGGDEMAA